MILVMTVWIRFIMDVIEGAMLNGFYCLMNKPRNLRGLFMLWRYSIVMVSESSFSFTASSTIAAILSGSAPWFEARAFMASVSAVICVSMMCVCASMYPSLSPSFAVVPLYFTGCSVIN